MAAVATPAKPSADTRTSANARRVRARMGVGQKHVDVREFIQKNYTPYEGDESFLAGPTDRTRKLWDKLLPMLSQEERKEGRGLTCRRSRPVLPLGPAWQMFPSNPAHGSAGNRPSRPYRGNIRPGWTQASSRAPGHHIDKDSEIIVGLQTVMRRSSGRSTPLSAGGVFR